MGVEGRCVCGGEDSPDKRMNEPFTVAWGGEKKREWSASPLTEKQPTYIHIFPALLNCHIKTYLKFLFQYQIPKQTKCWGLSEVMEAKLERDSAEKERENVAEGK